MSVQDQLANVNPETGTFPRTRVSDHESASRICQNVIDQNKKRCHRNSLVQGLIDGNPPYQRAKLKGSGQGYRSNFNDNQALSLQEVALTAYYDLFSEVPHWANVRPDTGDPALDDKLGKKITHEFHELQKKDACMEDAINVSQHEMVTYGSGPLVFDRDDDWTFSAVKFDDFMLSNNEPSEMDKWTKLVIRERMTVAQLASHIQNPEVAQTLGFETENVKKSILQATDNRIDVHSESAWQSFQAAIRQNDLEYTGPDREVTVGRLFFREFPSDEYPEGGISEVWINLDHPTHGFLFRKLNNWKTWSDFMQAFMLNRGTGSYHSIKGLGVRMYSALQTKLRLDNAVVDSAFFMASIHARKKAGGPAGSEGALYLGPLTMWKQEYEPMNFQNSAAGIQAASAVTGRLDQKLQSNLSQFQPTPPEQQGNPRSATEVMVTANQQSVLTKTSIAKYFKQLDGLYQERFRRAAVGDLNSITESARLAREFRKKLAEIGITSEILKTCKVYAVRTVGRGSDALRQQTIGSLWASVGGVLPEGGKDALLNDLISSQVGFDAISRYNPENKMAVTEQDHAWDAKIENGNVMVGGQPYLTDTQDDFIHAVVHLEELQMGISAVGQGTDPTKIAMFGMEIAPHIQEHIGRITDDPLRRDKVKALISAFRVAGNQLEQIVQSLQQEQESGNQEAEASQQVSESLSLDAVKQQAEMEMAREKHEQSMKFAQENHDQQIALNDARAADQVRQTKS